jgi:hypothetical protein
MSGTTTIDPIFAKIEAHRVAVEAMLAASDISAKLENNDDPGFEAADRVAARASQREMKVLRTLLGCRPTTLAGAVALLDHLGKPYTLRDVDGGFDTVLSLAHQWSKDKDEVVTFPHMLAGALRSLIGEVRT